MSDNSNKAETSKSMDSFRIKENWTVGQVCGLLKRAGLTTFKVARSILFGDPKERLEILKVIKNQPKVFNDPIHGSIELHPLLVRIIDTPEFQRLRNIKQLGGAYFVYPGACHSRFEHCIGVAHLAGQLGQTLKKKQNNIISDEDILCVQIAGLCHDLGHGPFSHLFDEIFLKQEIKHEDISVKMFDDLVTKNGLNPLMKLYGVDHRLEEIKKMIHPKANPELVIPDEKSFLYEIVSNKTNGVDVDKFDYFARDCHYLGLQNNFDHQRFMLFARVCKDNDGKTHICMRDKEADSLYTMFQTRYYLHKNACQHRVKYGIDLMINDALEAAKDKQIEGLDKTLDQITQDIKKNDLTSFTQLTDHVFEQILHSDNTELEKAKKILERIKSRDLYKCVFEKPVGRKENIKQLKTQLIELTKNQPEDKRLTQENFEVAYVTMDYGMGEKDPVKSMYFYTKSDPDTATKMDKKRVSQLIPNRFSETVLRVYKKSGRMDPKDLEEVFEQ